MDDLEFDNQFDLDDVVDADLHHSLQDKIKKYVRNRKYLVGHAGLCTIQIIVLIVFLAIIIPIALNKDENDNHDNNSNNNSTWKFTPPANRFKFSDMFKYSMEYPEITWIGNDRSNEGWVEEITDINGRTELVKFNYSVQVVDKTDNQLVEPTKTVLYAADEYPQNADLSILSPDGAYILFGFDKAQLYRHSFYANYMICNVAYKTCNNLTETQAADVRLVSWSKRNCLAYVKNRDIYVVRDPDNPIDSTYRITEDGESSDNIINGAPDWVYEEEMFESNSALFWSDEWMLAFIKFNQTTLPTYEIPFYKYQVYPTNFEYRYPAPGIANSNVSLWFVDILAENRPWVTEVPLNNIPNLEYIANVYWMNSTHLAFRVLNRLQNQQQLYCQDIDSNELPILLTSQSSPTWIEPYQKLLFINNGTQFIDVLYRNNYKHAVLFDSNGNELLDLLQESEYDVEDLVYFHHDTQLLFFTICEPSPETRNLHSVSLLTSLVNHITDPPGASWNYVSATFSPTGSYFILYQYTLPSTSSYATASLNKLTNLQDNAEVKGELSELALPKRYELTFSSANASIQLNAAMYLPDLSIIDQSEHKYPVLLYVYGGPDSQTVSAVSEFPFWYFHSYLISSLGFIVVSVDGRGTCCRGEAFLKCTYKNLGDLEVADQLAVVEQLATLPYVDATRIGIWGWSYGGYTTARVITANNPLVKLGISVSPVTDWLYYDNIYTERYMQTPQSNPTGYASSSVIGRANQIPKNSSYLLIHGTADDNVHFQNSANWLTDLIQNNPNFNYKATYFPDKNHSILGTQTRTYLWKLITSFLGDTYNIEPLFDDTDEVSKNAKNCEKIKLFV